MDFSIVLFDDFESRKHLFPLVETRPISDLRIGAFTIVEKWALFTGADISFWTVDYLQQKYPLKPLHSTILLVNGSILPSKTLLKEIIDLEFDCCLFDKESNFLAVKITFDKLAQFEVNTLSGYAESYSDITYLRLLYPEDIFSLNAKQIALDIDLLDLNKSNVNNWKNVQFFGDDIYISASASLEKVTIDSRLGPVFIDEDVILEPNVFIKGPVYIGKGSRIKAGTVLYPNVTIGPQCTVCGELNNTVIWGNSAKGHTGYLGCAVLGEGCNLGAGTTNSNLRNDWNTVKVYDYNNANFRDTSLLKCGVVIGDHVMLGIQSMITTGTVIGVGAQIAMSKFIPKFVPDFSWITDSKNETYHFEQFEGMMMRKSNVKNEELKDEDVRILKYLHDSTQYLRIK